MGLDFEKIKSAAEGYRADMTAFLSSLIFFDCLKFR